MENINWDLIVADFKNNTSISELSRKYNIGYGKINNYLIKEGYKIIKHYKISDEKYNQIKDAIKNGLSQKEIKEIYSTDNSTIKNIAKENNLMISRHNTRNENNKNFKDDYFNNIDSEQKAYFIGLLYTDGNVRIHNGGYFTSISLDEKDANVVEVFSRQINCGNKISHRERKTNYGYSNSVEFCTCNSKQMFDDLSKFDIIPNKSYNSDSFKNIEKLIPAHLIRHFLRGLIDGDGSISNRQTCKSQNCIYFAHRTKECCELFDYLLKKYSGLSDLCESIQYKESSHLHYIRYRRINDVKKICNFLYSDTNIYLERKYNRAKMYFDNDYFITNKSA